MFAVQDLRRVLSALNRMGLAVLRVTNVANVRGSVLVRYLNVNNVTVVVSEDGNEAFRRRLIVLASLSLSTKSEAARQARTILLIRVVAECNNGALYRTVARRRVSASNVCRFLRLEACMDTYHERSVEVVRTRLLTRSTRSDLISGLVFRLRDREEALAINSVVGIALLSRDRDVVRGFLLSEANVVRLDLRNSVRLLPRAERATRANETRLTRALLGLL